MCKITSMVIALLVVFFIAVKIGHSANPFTADGQKWESAPTGHIPGKDNGTDSGVSGGNKFHMPGEDCGICHNANGKASKYVFSMAGTIYKDRIGREPVQGAEIIMKDVNGNVISMTSNEAGNFFTYASIASDPASGKADTDSSSWRYKSWVKYGNYVTPMVTIAGVGGSSSTTARMSCGMHHGPLGSRGALFAGGFSTLPSYPSSGLSFKKHVLPILRNKCKACHMPASAKPTTEYPTGTKYDYSGELDLSAYSKDSGSAKGISDIVNTVSPDASKLLTVATLGSQHAGGGHWASTDEDYKAIRQWIAEGAQNN